MAESLENELLRLNQRLLDSIAQADWSAYRELCDPGLTCFEPEAQGHLVQGLPFHEFYFKLGAVQGEHLTTMSSPHVRIVGNVAVVCYVRLNQRLGQGGNPTTHAVAETRIWERQASGWRHIHFHRSQAPG